MTQTHRTKLNEKGFASIVIALIFIVVLALLTVGFAQLARREQQTALDKQLASQANYAAESGINAAYRDIIDKNITPANADSQHCMAPLTGVPGAATASHTIDANNGVSYTCLLVEVQTKDLTTDDLTPGTGRHINFGTGNNAPLTSITLTWGSASNRNTFVPSLDPTKPTFPTLNSWSASSYPPVIQFSLTPVVDPGHPATNLASQSDPNKYLLSNTFNFYAYPAKGGSNIVGFDPSKQGQVIAGNCSGTGTYPCSVTVNIPAGITASGYVVHYMDFYDSSNIRITGNVGGVTPGPATFTGEPMIDVTGQARNVVKRLHVRVLVNGGQDGTSNDGAILPNSAIEAQNLCKRIQAAPSTADFPQGSTYDDLDSSCSLSN